MKHTLQPQATAGRTMNLARQYFLPLCIAAFALVGCGGGASTGTTGTGTGTGSTGSGTVGGTTSTQPTLVLSLATLGGAALANNAVSAGTTFQASALVKSSTGAGLVNQLVKFTVASGSTLVTMTPPSGEVLTDATGKASVTLTAVAPSLGGAVVMSASAAVGAVALTATGSSGSATIGPANVSLGTVSYVPSQPTASTLLPTNSTVAIQIPVTSNGVAVNSASLSSFSVTSPCQAMQPPQAEIVPVGIVAGVLTVNYKNKGCAASPDIVTISMTGVNTPVTATLYTATSTPAELKFVGSTPSVGTSLVVKGSAGLGRQESGMVRFRLVDNAGLGVSNSTPVLFRLTTQAGGLSLGATTPISSTYTGYTDPDGYVEVALFSGTVPTPVSVLASTVYLGVTLSAASSVLSVSVGVAEQRSFSFGPEKASLEALGIDGVTTDFTALLADLWGNSVADGTIVNMVTEGGQIGAATGGACSTVNGACKLTFRSQNFRPKNGRVSLVAYAAGIDSFNDANGNGVYDVGEEIFNNGDPYIDYNENGLRSVNLPFVAGAQTNLYPSSAEFYVSNTGAYNPPKLPTTAQAQRNPTTIFKQSTIVFSGDPSMLIQVTGNFNYLNPYGAASPSYNFPTPPLFATPDLSTGATYSGIYTNAFTLDAWDTSSGNYAVDFRGSCQPQFFVFKVTDVNNNPVPSGSGISVDSPTSLTAGTVSPDKILNNISWGGSAHHVLITPDSTKCGTSHPLIPAVAADPAASPPVVGSPAIPAIVVTGYFGIKVSTPGGVNVTFTLRARY